MQIEEINENINENENQNEKNETNETKKKFILNNIIN